jgi:hypothetical protein
MKKGRKMISWACILITAVLAMCSTAAAGDFSITHIKPVFNRSTPGFGAFEVVVGIKSNVNEDRKVYLACLYLGLTHPGVYVENEPQVQKQHQVINLKPMQQVNVVLKDKFVAYHPETLGELVVTLVGTDTARSFSLRTAFHPKSQD